MQYLIERSGKAAKMFSLVYEDLLVAYFESCGYEVIAGKNGEHGVRRAVVRHRRDSRKHLNVDFLLGKAGKYHLCEAKCWSNYARDAKALCRALEGMSFLDETRYDFSKASVVGRQSEYAIDGKILVMWDDFGVKPDGISRIISIKREVLRKFKRLPTEKHLQGICEAFADIAEIVSTTATETMALPLWERLPAPLTRISASQIQKVSGRGYNVSARVVEQWEKEGIVGPAVPGVLGREVLRAKDVRRELSTSRL